ncbi:hypothetical protein Aperf_G00000097642 [Anoplocephala perfoliata]
MKPDRFYDLELLSAATASPLFSNGAGMTTTAAQVAYSPNTVALMNAIRQAAAASAATLPQQSIPQAMVQLVASAQPSALDNNGTSNSRKRSSNGDSDAQGATPSKRSSSVVEEGISVSNTMNQAAAARASSSTSQIAGTLAWLQQQQQAQQVQLVQQQTQLPSPPAPISLTPATSPAVAIQTAALLRLQQQAQQQLVQQQQQAQQNWAALFAPYTLNPLAFYDQFANGLTMSSLAGNLTQNQALITSCPYFTEDGHLIESLQLCRDFQAGKCHRNTECRYVHIADTKGLEVNQGRVTVCRDAAKGRCTRQPCRYYHIPLQVISVNRSHALNSVLNNAAASMTTLTSSAPTASPVATVSQKQATVALSTSAATSSSLTGSTNPAPAPSEPPPLSRSPSRQYGSPKTTSA